MNPRIPQTPPRILPLQDDAMRPLFSVMIPAYNCIEYLGTAIESVLAQDLGKDLMQIEVVDDASTDGDVRKLIQEIGKGRVEYYCQDENVGSLRNFETCLNRARGHYIHLLNGDDKVNEGFYREIKNLFALYPEAGAAFTRCKLMSADGLEFAVSKVNAHKAGILPNWLTKIAQYNRIQSPSIVVKRRVYEDLGSFFAIQYGEDWEMWIRIASKYPMAYSPKCLVSYRVHTNNITSRAFLSGQNITDFEKLLQIMENYLPENERKALVEKAKKYNSRAIPLIASSILYTYKDPKAALLQARSALKMHKDPVTLYRVSKFYLKYLCFYLRLYGSSQENIRTVKHRPYYQQRLTYQTEATK